MKSKRRILIEGIINILLNILMIIFGIILLVSIYTGIQTKILKNEYSNFFGYTLFEVQTGSMENTIKANDWIVVRITKKVKLNDIVTYKFENNYITHRIIEVYKDNYVTKGDANNSKDKPVLKDQIIGKVVIILGNFGTIRKVLFNPSVLVALIITLFLFNMAINKDRHKKSRILNKIKLLFNKIKNKIIKKEENSIENEPRIEKINIEQPKENEELEKTSLYRVISVDADEVDNTLLEIAQNEINEKPVEETKDEEPEIFEEEIEEEKSLTKIKLELLKSKKNKKGKNIIDTFIILKKEELNELVNILIDKKLIKATIKKIFIDAYIDAKYYDLYGGKNTISKIENAIKEVASNLVEKDKVIVKTFSSAFIIISKLEKANTSITDLKAKNEFYKKELKKYNSEFNEEEIREILKTQRNYDDMVEYFLKNLETSIFKLNFNSLSKKDMYGLDLEHNVSFSKVYSDYIIDKTYTEGVIAEDKLSVLFTILSSQLIKDMIASNFNKKYILYIQDSLYKKKKKLEKLFSMIDDKYAKNSIVLLITYKNLLTYKNLISEFRKQGYKFGLLFENDDIKDKKVIYIADYIFINKKDKNLSYIPEELKNNIVFEDIKQFVGDIRSDE